jgi:hypothetical protein
VPGLQRVAHPLKGHRTPGQPLRGARLGRTLRPPRKIWNRRVCGAGCRSLRATALFATIEGLEGFTAIKSFEGLGCGARASSQQMVQQRVPVKEPGFLEGGEERAEVLGPGGVATALEEQGGEGSLRFGALILRELQRRHMDI